MSKSRPPEAQGTAGLQRRVRCSFLPLFGPAEPMEALPTIRLQLAVRSDQPLAGWATMARRPGAMALCVDSSHGALRSCPPICSYYGELQRVGHCFVGRFGKNSWAEVATPGSPGSIWQTHGIALRLRKIAKPGAVSRFVAGQTVPRQVPAGF